MAQLTPSIADTLIGKRMQLRRKERGLTADQLSEKIGISQQQLLRYERGDNKININHLMRVAEALETPLNWFFLDCCSKATLTNEELKARYDFHWQQFDAQQRQAVVNFLDFLSIGYRQKEEK
ncbi:helix-turn-helix domain-containing protein [Pelistega ratti]|uniref:helix-turn-helix domain-containing protein n=1 Tax=Pelistega ratti TaxID=2652177 RepID=UPI00135A078C|nr:helix-turn-helix transcriptional regulator [Pelistega ratti]